MIAQMISMARVTPVGNAILYEPQCPCVHNNNILSILYYLKYFFYLRSCSFRDTKNRDDEYLLFSNAVMI